MNLNEYQTQALSTLVFPTEPHLSSGLAAEVGEVMSLLQKYHRKDPRYFSTDPEISEHSFGFLDHYTEQFYTNMLKELGDVLWYLACLASLYDFTLEEVAETNLKKLSLRKETGQIQGDGDNR